MRCAMCNREMRSSFDDYEGGLCARCAHRDMRSTTITFIPNDGLAYRQFITPRQEPLSASAPCIICGENTEICQNMSCVICDKCKEAILCVRQKIEQENKTGDGV